MKYLLTFCIIFYTNLSATPPTTIPADLYKDFTLGGQIKVQNYYLDNTVPNGKTKHIPQENIAKLIEQVKQHNTFYYGMTDTWLYQALEKYTIKDQKVAIFGSLEPVYEAICLCYGGTPITIEYNKWTTDHPSLLCITPDEYKKNPILFDSAFSISSFEHDGLGRYGDPINPWADLEIMKRAKQMIKPNGLLFLAVPVAQDRLAWNAHRVYGKLRLPLLLAGWELIDSFGIQNMHDPALTKEYA